MSILSKRVPTIGAILVLVIGIASGVWMVQRQKQGLSKTEIVPKEVRITNVAANKFTVSWITTQATKGKVVYGKVGEKLVEEALDDRDKGKGKEGSYLTHHITVEGLQPSTQYAFKIISGDKERVFDNNGSPYEVKTGPILSQTPKAEAVYGMVKKGSSLPAEGAIVYVEVPGATPLSTLTTSSGSWTVPISTARTLNLDSYVNYDAEATIFSVKATSGEQRARAKVTLRLAKPVPEMVLGQTYDFVSQATPEPSSAPSASGSGQLVAQEEKGGTPGIFNIEPLGENEASSSGEVMILNPEVEGEIISSDLPEFRGKGKAGMVLSVSLEGVSSEYTASENVSVDTEGTWSWVPTKSLADGDYELSVSYIDDAGVEQKISRGFTVRVTEELPAFEASGSGEATPSPRVSMPATDSGVPVSGSVGVSIMILVVGFAILVLGGWLWTI